MRQGMERRAWVLWSCGLTMALVLAGCGSRAAEQVGGGAPPPVVEVVKVVEEDVPLVSEWVATLDGSVNAQIQPQVTGYLVKQTYREGEAVKQGQVLFEIDARPMEAALEQAQAQWAQAESAAAQARSTVAQAESEVAQAKAQQKKAELDVKRDEPLAAARAVSQAQYEAELQALAAAEANVKAAQARVGASVAGVKTAEAGMAAARAAVKQAELMVGFTKVRSLIDGIAGVAQTQIGNLVKPETVLTSVSKVNPIRVYFPISESEYLELAGAGRKEGGLLGGSGSPELELVLTNGTVHGWKGRVAFADRQVDAQTGTMKMAAEFANPGHVLRPGQFGRVRTTATRMKGALLVPQRAVSDVQGKYQIAVVDGGGKVQVRGVVLGPAVGSRYVIRSGVKVGESVVVEGVLKATDGATVVAKPAAGGKAGH